MNSRVSNAFPSSLDDEPASKPEPDDPGATEVGAQAANQIGNALFKSRVVTVFGEVTDKLAREVVSQLLALDSMSHDPIRVFVNSPGGHVESGDTIHDMMRFISSPVRVIGTGWVASAGVMIYLGARRGQRFCLPNTRFMLHQPIGAFRGQASDALIHANEVRKMRERINRIIARETGQPLERVQADSDRDYWLTAEEALGYGIVDRIVTNASE